MEKRIIEFVGGGNVLILSILTFFLGVLAPSTGKTQSFEPVVISEETQMASLEGHLSILVDSSYALDTQQLKEAAFSLVDDQYPNLGVIPAPVWIKFRLTNESDREEFRVFMESNNTLKANLYYQSDSGTWQMKRSGNLIPFSKRDVQSKTYAFNISLAPGDSQNFYLQINSSEHLLIPMSVANKEAFLERENQNNLFFGIFAGVFIGLILYNLFVYFTLREKSYFLYVLHTVFSLITQMIFLGYASKLLWPENLWWAENGKTLFTCLVSLIGIEFMKEFLSTRSRARGWHRLSYIFSGFYILAIGLVLSGLNELVYQILSPIQVGVVLLVIATSLSISRKGFRPAIIFVLSWIAFLLGIIIYVLATEGFIEYNQYTSFMMPLGSVVEILLLSFALADKINYFKKEKEEANERVLDLALKNEKFVREQNVLLEKRVKERTNDLSQTVEKLDNAYKKLKSAQSQLVSNEKMASLGQLTAGIAHEINNPINFISGSLVPLKRDVEDLVELYKETEQLALEKLSEEDFQKIRDLKEELEFDFVVQEIHQLLNSIKDGTERTVTIIRGLKTFSRVDDTDTKSVDLHEGIESTLTLIHNTVRDKIQLVKNFGSIPQVECYAGEINQVFLNLLNNAAQAILMDEDRTEKGKIEIDTKYVAEDERVEIIITDNGPGIPQNIQEKIFEPFFTTKPIGKGTGLGLSICYNIINKHQGTITVSSEKGKGTIFTISLPVRQEDEDSKS